MIKTGGNMCFCKKMILVGIMTIDDIWEGTRFKSFRELVQEFNPKINWLEYEMIIKFITYHGARPMYLNR